MKRFIVISSVLLVAAVAAIYVLIPADLEVVSVAIAPLNADAAFRVVSKPSNWQQFTSNKAGINVTDTSQFQQGKYTFSVTGLLHNALKIEAANNQRSINTFFTTLPHSRDSVALRWEAIIHSGNNPFSKLSQYNRAASLKKSFDAVLTAMQQFLSKEHNVYGYRFAVTSTTDTLLIATKTTHAGMPGTAELYRQVNSIAAFAVAKGATVTGQPRMNVTRTDHGAYQLMVALPVDRTLPTQGAFLHRKMIPGNFLVTDVTGGPGTIANALNMMTTYIRDAGKTSMAIPFQVVKTNRLQQPDTSQWQTRIYYPIVR